MATIATKKASFSLFIKRGGTVHRFEAIGNAESPYGYEVTAEPGATARIGPRVPRKLSFTVICADGGEAASFSNVVFSGSTPITSKTSQLELLESLAGRELEFSGRLLTPSAEGATWTIQNTRVVDNMSSDEHFTVQVECIELIGGGSSPVPAVREGTLQVPIPIGEDIDDTEGSSGEGDCPEPPSDAKLRGQDARRFINSIAEGLVEDGINGFQVIKQSLRDIGFGGEFQQLVREQERQTVADAFAELGRDLVGGAVYSFDYAVGFSLFGDTKDEMCGTGEATT